MWSTFDTERRKKAGYLKDLKYILKAWGNFTLRTREKKKAACKKQKAGTLSELDSMSDFEYLRRLGSCIASGLQELDIFHTSEVSIPVQTKMYGLTVDNHLCAEDLCGYGLMVGHTCMDSYKLIVQQARTDTRNAEGEANEIHVLDNDPAYLTRNHYIIRI